MSVSAVLRRQLTVTETLTVGVDDVSTNSTLLHNGFDVGPLTFDAGTALAATKYSGQQIPLVAGAKTIDLTNLVGPNNSVVDLTGIKPIAFVFKNTGTNDMTIAVGASNGYTGFGAALSLNVPAGMQVSITPSSVTASIGPAAVDSTHKTLDILGTGTQTFDLAVLGGS